jgi:cytochrome c1
MRPESSSIAARGRSGARERRAGPAGQWLVLACAGLVACDGPPDRTPTLGDADTARGRQLVVEKGCTACHTFPDIEWPRGGLGPSLENFGHQGLIAGRLPNQPGVLMSFVRNAPAWVPGTAMPTVPMTDQEARDVTAYLLELRSR